MNWTHVSFSQKLATIELVDRNIAPQKDTLNKKEWYFLVYKNYPLKDTFQTEINAIVSKAAIPCDFSVFNGENMTFSLNGISLEENHLLIKCPFKIKETKYFSLKDSLEPFGFSCNTLFKSGNTYFKIEPKSQFGKCNPLDKSKRLFMSIQMCLSYINILYNSNEYFYKQIDNLKLGINQNRDSLVEQINLISAMLNEQKELTNSLLANSKNRQDITLIPSLSLFKFQNVGNLSNNNLEGFDSNFEWFFGQSLNLGIQLATFNTFKINQEIGYFIGNVSGTTAFNKGRWIHDGILDPYGNEYLQTTEINNFKETTNLNFSTLSSSFFSEIGQNMIRFNLGIGLSFSKLKNIMVTNNSGIWNLSGKYDQINESLYDIPSLGLISNLEHKGLTSVLNNFNFSTLNTSFGIVSHFKGKVNFNVNCSLHWQLTNRIKSLSYEPIGNDYLPLFNPSSISSRQTIFSCGLVYSLF